MRSYEEVSGSPSRMRRGRHIPVAGHPPRGRTDPVPPSQEKKVHGRKKQKNLLQKAVEFIALNVAHIIPPEVSFVSNVGKDFRRADPDRGSNMVQAAHRTRKAATTLTVSFMRRRTMTEALNSYKK